MLRNSDGQPYTTAGSIQAYDPQNNESCLLNDWDEEIIKQRGSPIYYHEVFIQIGSLDRLYREDRGKLWSNNPIQLWAIYDPFPDVGGQMTDFGLDGVADIIFETNFRAVIRDVGHLPKIGSLIFSPHRRENWVVISYKKTDPKLWGEIRLQLICSRFQDTVTDSCKTTPATDYDIQNNLATRG